MAPNIDLSFVRQFEHGLLRKAIADCGGSAGVIECANHKPKAVRILEAFDARLAAGVLHMHDSVAQTGFLAELRDWRPGTGRGGAGRGGSHQRDDGLDAVAGCLLSEPVRIGSLMGGGHAGARAIHRDWRGSAAPLVAPSDFSI